MNARSTSAGRRTATNFLTFFACLALGSVLLETPAVRAAFPGANQEIVNPGPPGGSPPCPDPGPSSGSWTATVSSDPTSNLISECGSSSFSYKLKFFAFQCDPDEALGTVDVLYNDINGLQSIALTQTGEGIWEATTPCTLGPPIPLQFTVVARNLLGSVSVAGIQTLRIGYACCSGAFCLPEDPTPSLGGCNTVRMGNPISPCPPPGPNSGTWTQTVSPPALACDLDATGDFAYKLQFSATQCEEAEVLGAVEILWFDNRGNLHFLDLTFAGSGIWRGETVCFIGPPLPDTFTVRALNPLLSPNNVKGIGLVDIAFACCGSDFCLGVPPRVCTTGRIEPTVSPCGQAPDFTVVWSALTSLSINSQNCEGSPLRSFTIGAVQCDPSQTIQPGPLTKVRYRCTAGSGPWIDLPLSPAGNGIWVTATQCDCLPEEIEVWAHGAPPHNGFREAYIGHGCCDLECPVTFPNPCVQDIAEDPEDCGRTPSTVSPWPSFVLVSLPNPCPTTTPAATDRFSITFTAEQCDLSNSSIHTVRLQYTCGGVLSPVVTMAPLGGGRWTYNLPCSDCLPDSVWVSADSGPGATNRGIRQVVVNACCVECDLPSAGEKE